MKLLHVSCKRQLDLELLVFCLDLLGPWEGLGILRTAAAPGALSLDRSSSAITPSPLRLFFMHLESQDLHSVK